VVKILFRALTVCVALAVAAGMAAAAPAAFAGVGVPPGSGTGSTTPSTDPPADHTTWHNCSIVSGPSYVGGVCAGSASEGKSIKEILGEDPVPDCWHEPVSDAELAAMGQHNVPGPDGYTYYWYHCLTGINPKTKVPEPGGIHISTELVTLPNSKPPLTLTDNQQDLVDGRADQGNVPTPIAVVSPSDHPRVGLDVAFANASSGDFYVRPLGAVIHAYVDRTTIEPLGAGVAPKIGCPGNGTLAKPGQTPVDGDGLCWYRYVHSSAGQPNDVYDVRITSHWVVEISATGEAGTFERLDDFQKSATTRIPVTEIQTLVVQ
jgi:hypothetical protein